MGGLEGLGEWQGYEPKIRVITPKGFVYRPHDFLVKFYTMFEKGFEPYENEEVDFARDAVYEKIRKGKILRHCGLGVAVLSEGVLNIGMWGNYNPNGTPYPDFPSILHPHVFSFPEDAVPNNLEEFEMADLSQFGSHCRWELELLGGHEAHVWGEYMMSGRIKQDKIAWRDDTIACEI